MVVKTIDHHTESEGVDQTQNVVASIYGRVGAAVTLSLADSLANEGSLYWPKEMMMVGLATLYDDTDGLNTEDGNAFAYDHYIFKEVLKRYYRGTVGFDETDSAEKMIVVASKLIKYISRIGKNELFKRDDFQVYRRVSAVAPVFSRSEAEQIQDEYSAHLSVLKKIFFMNEDGTITLKKEIEVSELEYVPDIDIVLDMMLRYRWRDTLLSLEELKKLPLKASILFSRSVV